MAGQETLLRAATPADQTDPNQLLRSTFSQPSPPLIESDITELPLLEPQTHRIETTHAAIHIEETPAPETLVQQTFGS